MGHHYLYGGGASGELSLTVTRGGAVLGKELSVRSSCFLSSRGRVVGATCADVEVKFVGNGAITCGGGVVAGREVSADALLGGGALLATIGTSGGAAGLVVFACGTDEVGSPSGWLGSG